MNKIKLWSFYIFKNIFYHVTLENIFRIFNNSVYFQKTAVSNKPLRVLKSKKWKPALTFLYCLGQEKWSDDSWKLNYINQSRFYNFFHVEKLKNVYISSRYFSISNNKPPASWVAHISRDFLTCYSCSIIVPWLHANAIKQSYIIILYRRRENIENAIWKISNSCEPIRIEIFLCASDSIRWQSCVLLKTLLL